MTTYRSGAEWVRAQKEKIKRLEEDNVPLKQAAAATHAMYINRIFNDHKASDNSALSYKSKRPVYINPKTQSPKSFPTKNKDGFLKRKDGKPFKTGYFTSYAEFKKVIGRPILELFGNLRNDVAAGFKKIGSQEYSTTAKNALNQKKVAGIQKRWGKKIFDLSKKEKEFFQETISKKFKEYMADAS